MLAEQLEQEVNDLSGWQAPETAPKEDVIIACFDDCPLPVTCTWNEPEQQWVFSLVQVNQFEGKWNDTFFQTEYETAGALKAWIDQICRVGVTFQYTENGPVDLLTGKRAIVVMASGGMPIGSAADYASRYIRHVLGFIGISDLTIISADALGQDAADKVATASVEINKAA